MIPPAGFPVHASRTPRRPGGGTGVPRTWQTAALFAAWGVLSLAGCASNRPWEALSRNSKPPVQVAENGNPVPPQSLQNDATSLGDAAGAPRPGNDAAQATVSPRRHAPATTMLIDAELQDASPEERAEWIAYLNTVDAAQVPYLLRDRRMAVNRRVDSVVQDNAPSDNALPPALQAGGESVARVAADPIPVISPAGNPADAAPRVAPPAAQEPPANTTLSKRFFALAEPSWPWTHSDTENSPQREDDRQERSAFGLPALLGTNSRAAAPAAAPEVQQPPVQTANAPARPVGQVQVTPGSQLWEDELRKVISLLEAESAAFPGDAPADRKLVRKQLALRLLYLVNEEPLKAQQAIAGLPPSEQEFWTSIFVTLADNLDDESPLTPEERATKTIAQLRVAAHQLQNSARLEIRNATFCEEIAGFGSYRETLRGGSAAPLFAPGQSVLVYAEIKNFRSEPTVDGYYRTVITSAVEVIGPDGRVQDRKSYPAEDLCRTLRSDYFHSYRIDLPPGLAAGDHVLKLTIKDELTGKLATESISFSVR